MDLSCSWNNRRCIEVLHHTENLDVPVGQPCWNNQCLESQFNILLSFWSIHEKNKQTVDWEEQGDQSYVCAQEITLNFTCCPLSANEAAPVWSQSYTSPSLPADNDWKLRKHKTTTEKPLWGHAGRHMPSSNYCIVFKLLHHSHMQSFSSL